PGLARVALLASTIFLGSLSAMLNLADASARMRGQGLLLLLAAGFPLGIAQQNLLAVLGAVLVFSPGRPQSAAEAIRSEAPLEGLPSVSK
ncbi:MAG TPA: hypothetical protein VFP98_01160, partial [Candidatus Polarisedimenticolia bacterium]|nr:hypothetical protein [Candidatus Polarisedimenticolia bacterium]